MEIGTRLFLVTCGQTTQDRAGVFQSATDHQLTLNGKKDVRLLSMYLKEKEINSFYSSPFDGALTTASTVAARHRMGVIKLPELQDMDFGRWIGMTPQQLKVSQENDVIAWQFTPHQFRMPGGETLEEVQARVTAALEGIVSVERGNSVCVVSHAIPVKTAMCHFMNEDLSIIWHTPRQESTALNIIDLEDGEAKVMLVGSLEHLGEESPA
jgi:broad specificity phosphatase PhoE